MGWADEFSGGSAAPAKSWVDEFTAPVVATAPAKQPSTWDEVLRQIGLTARAGVTGLTGLPALAGNGINSLINLGTSGVNAVAGTEIPALKMPSQAIQDTMTAAGVPEPRNNVEKLVQAGTAGLVSAAPNVALGNLLLKNSTPVQQGTQQLGQLLKIAPGNQMAAGMTGGVVGQAAANEGLNPYWQLTGSVLGGLGGALGSAAVGSSVRNLGAAVAPGTTEAVFPGSIPKSNPKQAPAAVEATAGSSPLTPGAKDAQSMENSTAALLKANPNADASAAARAADFRALGIKPTLAQILRDPGLFAREMNWRGADAGAPLLSRFRQQNQQLGQALESVAGTGKTAYTDGITIQSALAAFDDAMRSNISDAYKAARASTGKDMDVPLQGLAQDYAQTLKDFGDKIPSGVRNNFEDLGLTSGTQKKVFTIEDAENLLKVINDNKTTDPAVNTALAKLNKSVKDAVLNADDQGGVFAQARQLAAQRFALHDKVPALKDAVYGKTAPEDFATRHIINGNVEDLAGLSQLLNTVSPKAVAAVRGQVGNRLQQAAFGQNMAGDKPFSPEAYARLLNNQIGPENLNTIYGQEAADALRRIGRVGALIHSEPAFSPVNRSNTGSAVLDMASEIPVVGRALGAAAKKSMIKRSLEADLNATGNYSVPATLPMGATVNGYSVTNPVQAKP